MVKVQSVLMGYAISMRIQLDASSGATERVNTLLEKAKSTGGSPTIYGNPVGLGASGESKTTSSITFDDVKSKESGTLIDIPPHDNTYPTLLAVLGCKLDTTVTNELDGRPETTD